MRHIRHKGYSRLKCPKLISKVLLLRQQGKTQVEIAKELGLYQSEVSRLLKQVKNPIAKTRGLPARCVKRP